MHKVCYVIADAGRARLVRQRVEDGAFVTFEILAPSQEVGFGRRALRKDKTPVYASHGMRRHLVEPRLGVRYRALRAFALEIVLRLEALIASGAYDSIVLVAPTRMLQAVERYMSPQLTACLVGELAKDLSKMPDHDLYEHLWAANLGDAVWPGYLNHSGPIAN